MRIGNSSVAMSSERTYASYGYTQSMTLTGRRETTELIDPTSKESIMDQMQQIQEDLKEQEKLAADEAKQREQENLAAMMKRQAANVRNNPVNFAASSIYELKVKLLEQMVRMLRKARGEDVSDSLDSALDNYRASLNNKVGMFGVAGMSNSGITSAESLESSGNIVSNSGVFVMQRVDSAFYGEQEKTAFTSNGVVTTKDGREINFDITFEMSRSFETSVESYYKEEVYYCDPLVINFDGDVAELGDQKFMFDIDADGNADEISGFTSNSGFLALDKNGDGKINDGSELFGASSGDGFKDLAAYDNDGNGWIDEDDEVFSKLKVWTKDANGNDKVMSIKDAGLGAIYLGNVDTGFSLNSAEDNSTNGMIRKSGVYLNEDGSAGIIQHVDFAI